MLRNLYIRKADETFWVRVEERAKKSGTPLSLYVSNLLRQHLYGTDGPAVPADTMETLRAEIDERLEKMQKLAGSR